MANWKRARLGFCGYEDKSIHFVLIGEDFDGSAYWQGLTIDEDSKDRVFHIMRKFDLAFEVLDRRFREKQDPRSLVEFESEYECVVDANHEVFPVIVDTVRRMLKLKGVPYWVRPIKESGENNEKNARSAAAGSDGNSGNDSGSS